MGAQNLIAGLISHNIQSLAAVPPNILSDFRRSVPFYPKQEQALEKLRECVENWSATIDETCGADALVNSAREKFIEKYGNTIKAPPRELKAVTILMFKDILQCSDPPTLRCECKIPPYNLSSSKRNGRPIPKKDLNKNCDSEPDIFNTTGQSVTPSSVTDPDSLNAPSSVSDPSQNFQYILLMAVIFVITAN